MSAQGDNLDAAERGVYTSSTSSTKVGSDLEELGIKELSIPSIQAVYLDIRCFPVFSEEICHSIDDLRKEVIFHVNRCNDLKEQGIRDGRLSIARGRKTKALWEYYALLKLADEVQGFETPSRASLRELGNFHRQQRLPVPEAIEKLNCDDYRLIRPKRLKHEKELIQLWHCFDWNRWFAWAKIGELQGEGWISSSFTFSDRKVVVLAGALTTTVVCAMFVAPMALIPLTELTIGLWILISLALLSMFAMVQSWLFETNTMSWLVYAGFLAAILQVRVGAN